MAVFILLAVGTVFGATSTDFYFNQADGTAYVHTYARDEGTKWDWPSCPEPNTATGFVDTRIMNDGALKFEQHVEHFGTGLQWPDVAEPGEWSMSEQQKLNGAGETHYLKEFKVWTVHVPYATDYIGDGKWNMPEGLNEYDFEGTTSDEDSSKTTFQHEVHTDSAYKATSRVWINPFVN